MIARLLISPLPQRTAEINNIIKLPKNHPDVLYIPSDSKLGIAEARKVKEHFSLKPYSAKGRVVVLEDASVLTIEAQNALLKSLEELQKDGVFILGAESDAFFLPTILSRCQVIRVQSPEFRVQSYNEEIEKLEKANIEERFEFIEKLKDKENFLKSLVAYFHQKKDMRYLKELLQAEKWASQNVNIRAILEYLMLVMSAK